MEFSYKIRKAFRLQTYTQASAVRNCRRLVWYLRECPRLVSDYFTARRTVQQQREIAERRQRLRPETLLRSVDAEKLAQLRATYGDGQKSFWTKYLDVEKWLQLNVRYANELGLVARPPEDVLDLGCGAGFFLFVCKRLGCRVLGIDLDTDPIFNDTIRMFGVERVGYRIRPLVPLPDLDGRRFDLITAWMICFNDFDRPEAIWGPREWEFLINDLAGRLKPDGRIVFSLNKQLDGKLYSEEIGKVFARYSDLMDGKRILFSKATLDARRAEGQAPAGLPGEAASVPAAASAPR